MPGRSNWRRCLLLSGFGRQACRLPCHASLVLAGRGFAHRTRYPQLALVRVMVCWRVVTVFFELRSASCCFRWRHPACAALIGDAKDETPLRTPVLPRRPSDVTQLVGLLGLRHAADGPASRLQLRVSSPRCRQAHDRKEKKKKERVSKNWSCTPRSVSWLARRKHVWESVLSLQPSPVKVWDLSDHRAATEATLMWDGRQELSPLAMEQVFQRASAGGQVSMSDSFKRPRGRCGQQKVR